MDRNSKVSKFQDALRAYQLNVEMSEKQAKVTKAPLFLSSRLIYLLKRQPVCQVEQHLQLSQSLQQDK